MAEEKLQFLYIIKPHKENFADTMTEDEANIMGTHFLYLRDLMERDILIMAGPETSGKFGLCIIETASEDEARNIMNGDPAVQSGIVTAELHPYRVSLLRK